MFNKRIKAIFFVIILTFLLFSGCSNVPSSTPTVSGLLNIHYLDVGQGDCILIQTPEKQNILIDGGNDEEGQFIIDYLKRQRVERLQYVIATHPHADHIGGLDKVLEKIPADSIYLPNVVHSSKNFEELIDVIERKGIKAIEAKQGVKLNIDNGLQAEFLAPISDNYSNLNNYSAVLRLEYGNTSFIFTGDAEKESEEEMINKGLKLQANVLKVGHHGSSSSTTEDFLERVAPQYAVISLGKDNKYGHPHRETLEKLQERGISVLRTDEMGTIIATSDGKNISFNQDIEESEKLVAEQVERVDVEIISVDLVKEIVIIKNKGVNQVDISGWKLVSEKGKQEFIFPTETVLEKGDELKIICGKDLIEQANTLIWPENNIWNNKGDPAVLYNLKGEKISYFDEKGDKK